MQLSTSVSSGPNDFIPFQGLHLYLRHLSTYIFRALKKRYLKACVFRETTRPWNIAETTKIDLPLLWVRCIFTIIRRYEFRSRGSFTCAKLSRRL